MAHSKWCGKACAGCGVPCNLDSSIPCSPDCENLVGDEINLKACLELKCSEAGYIFGASDPEDISDEEVERLVREYGAVAPYPCG